MDQSHCPQGQWNGITCLSSQPQQGPLQISTGQYRQDQVWCQRGGPVFSLHTPLSSKPANMLKTDPTNVTASAARVLYTDLPASTLGSPLRVAFSTRLVGDSSSSDPTCSSSSYGESVYFLPETQGIKAIPNCVKVVLTPPTRFAAHPPLRMAILDASTASAAQSCASSYQYLLKIKHELQHVISSAVGNHRCTYSSMRHTASLFYSIVIATRTCHHSSSPACPPYRIKAVRRLRDISRASSVHTRSRTHGRSHSRIRAGRSVQLLAATFLRRCCGFDGYQYVVCCPNLPFKSCNLQYIHLHLTCTICSPCSTKERLLRLGYLGQ